MKDKSIFISKISFIFGRGSEQIIAIRSYYLWHNLFTGIPFRLHNWKMTVTFLPAHNFSLIAYFPISILATVFFQLNTLLFFVWVLVHLNWTIWIVSTYWVVPTSVTLNWVFSFSWNLSLKNIFSVHLIWQIWISLLFIFSFFIH